MQEQMPFFSCVHVGVVILFQRLIINSLHIPYMLRSRENFLRLASSIWTTTNLSNPSSKNERGGEVPTRQEQRNKKESKLTQYLTRLSNLPTSMGQGGEKFY